MRQSRLIVFDMDGVVLDSVGEIWLATLGVLQSFGVPMDRLPNLQKFLEDSATPGDKFYANYGITKSIQTLRLMLLEFISGYSQTIRPYSGFVEVVRHLRCCGFKIALVSASPSERVMEELRRFELRSLFDEIHGGETNKVSALQECCRSFGSSLSETYFIGDMISDMRDGRAAGVHPIGFAADFSFMRPVLIKAGADACIDEFKELPQLIK